MTAFLSEYARGEVQPLTLAAVAESFRTELKPKLRGRPRKGKRGLSGELSAKLNTSGRRHSELHAAIARGLLSGLSWNRVISSVGSEFGMTRDGVRRALEIFGLGSATRFRGRALPAHATLSRVDDLTVLSRVDWSDVPDDTPLAELLSIVRAREVCRK